MYMDVHGEYLSVIERAQVGTWMYLDVLGYAWLYMSEYMDVHGCAWVLL